MSNPLNSVFFNPARRTTPATEQAAPTQVRNNDRGYVFQIDDMERAHRFLILGSERSYYQAGSELSLLNAENLQKLARSDRAIELIDLITDVSVNGRAPKQSPGLFALAVVISQAEDGKVKAYGYQKLPEIARTASTLFEFTSYLNQFQQLGGMGFQKAVGRWYTEKSVDKLAYQMVKYRQRNGFDHSRLLRLSKRVKSDERPELGSLLNWALGKNVDRDLHHLPDVVQGFELAKIPGNDIPSLIREFGLSWEMIPTEALNEKKVWEALLDGNLPLGALIRQLPRLTNLGIIAQLGGRTADIEDRLLDREALKKARIHPLNALVAMRTYAAGRGERSTWSPARRIADVLEEVFYQTFEFVEPTNKRWLLGLDLSASMTWNNINKMPINPREAAACMAMVTARTERDNLITGFSNTYQDGNWYKPEYNTMVDLDISPRSRLQDVIKEISSKPAGGTDLSLPMEFAIANRLPVDAFVIYTDNETNSGRRHPFQALEEYRRVTGIPAKLIVVGMTSTPFSIANPDDPGMLDICGFDTAAPALMSDFVR